MMKTAILCALAALALTACQRAGEETTADQAVAADGVIDAVPSEAEPYRAATPEAPPATPRSQRPSRKAADIAADKAAAEAAARPAAADLQGPSETVREGAQQAAEETNLHPRTP